MQRRFSYWIQRLAIALALALVLVVTTTAIVIGPWVRDHLRLDWVVRAVALDWRDHGLEPAKERLQYELDHQGIGRWVADQNCQFIEPSEQRTVVCNWTGYLHVPIVERIIPLKFQSKASIDASGDIQ
jgi:hypothetical protein